MNENISERAFQQRVEKFLKKENVWFLKVWGNGIQRSGIPDLLICCNGQFIGCELKCENGKATELQMYELKQIQRSGGCAIILKPNEFDKFVQFIRQLKSETREVQNVFPQ